MAGEIDEVTIRPATATDAAAIAAVDVASWRGAYAGILPASFLADLDVSSRADDWSRSITDPAATVLVAEADGRTLGFTSVGPARDEDAEDGDLEVYAIYLDPEAWGRGVARELMRTALRQVPRGTPVSIWLLADNTRAQHFYRRHGFQPDGVERRDVIGGQDLTQVRYRRA